MLRWQRIFTKFDWWLFVGSLCISCLGLLLIYSLSWGESNLFIKQSIYLVLGLAMFFVVQIFDRNFWRNASWMFYVFCLLLLLFLLIFGDATNAARSWLRFGLFSIQPSELAKIATVLFLATILEKLNFNLWNWRHIFLVFFIIGFPTILIMLQPDFGSAAILAIASILMVLYIGLPQKALIIITGVSLLFLAFGWGILHDYQRDRILIFLHPETDPAGAGYNVRQALVAIGSGGLTGRGLGLGTQSKLNFLPEKETDFIFAVLAEDLGFIGALVLFVLYILIFWRLFRSLRGSSDLFVNFLLLGIFGIFISQAVINMAMNMSLLPVTGVPLPFVSYGGSSLVASWFALALAQSCRREW